MKLSNAISVVLVLSFVSVTLAHPGPRVHLYLENDELLTGFELANPDDTVTVTPGITRSFAVSLVSHATFGATTQFPGFGSEPSTIPGDPASPLPAGVGFFFNLLDKALFWNGSGPVDFGPTSGEQFLITGTAGGPITSGSGFVSGFQIGTTGIVGSGWHAHLRYSLDTNANGLPDGLDNPAAPAPDAGVYLLSMGVHLDHDGNPSTPDLFTDPFYLLLGQGVNQAVLDEAMTWVDANLVPEPISLALLAFLAGPCLIRRRLPRGQRR